MFGPKDYPFFSTVVLVFLLLLPFAVVIELFSMVAGLFYGKAKDNEVRVR